MGGLCLEFRVWGFQGSFWIDCKLLVRFRVLDLMFRACNLYSGATVGLMLWEEKHKAWARFLCGTSFGFYVAFNNASSCVSGWGGGEGGEVSELPRSAISSIIALL